MNYNNKIINDGREINVLAGNECDIDLRIYPIHFRFCFRWIDQEIRLFFFDKKARSMIERMISNRVGEYIITPLQFFSVADELSQFSMEVHTANLPPQEMNFSSIAFSDGLVGFTLTL